MLLPEPHAAHYRACLLGTLTLQTKQHPLALPGSAVARSLLAYLLLHRERLHPRALLVGLFWPEMPEPDARRAMSQALWYVRRAAPGLIDATPDTVQIAPQVPVWVDVAAFEKRVTPHLDKPGLSEQVVSDLSQAVSLYRGELLSGMYEDWISLERERLQQLYHEALERLFRLEKRAGRYQQALTYAQRLVEADPLYEAIHREIMQLQVALGRPHAALEQFETCRRVLEAELSLEPDPATLALVAEIAEQTGPHLIPHLPGKAPLARPGLSADWHGRQAPLVGREHERHELLACLEAIFSAPGGGAGISRGEASAPQGGLVLLEGEAGVGKTRLAQEIARDAEWRGALVLWGRGQEQEAKVPYGPLVEALRGGLSRLRVTQLAAVVEKSWLQVLGRLISEIADWLPDLAPPMAWDPAREPDRLAEVFAQCLAGWSQITPLTLVLEDLQWADTDTLDLLVNLARRLRESAVLILGTYRGEEARLQPLTWERLRALDRAGLRQRLLLPRLDEAATRELIRHTLGLAQPAPIFEQGFYRETEGNPLFILESLRALYDQGLLYRDERGNWATPVDEVTTDYSELFQTPAIERVIAQRVAQVPLGLRQVLQAAAVLGGPFDLAALQPLTTLGASELLAALNVLVRWRFLAETPEAYVFSHDKVRQVIYADIPAPERVDLHRRAAQALESASPGEVELLAHHFAQGEVWPKAVAYALAAGDHARAAHAYQAALDHYSRALEILERRAPFEASRSAELRFDILAARCNLFHLNGETERQAADLAALREAAASLNDPRRLAQAHNLQAHFLCYVRNAYRESREAAEEALALAIAHAMPRQQAPALQTIGETYLLSTQYRSAIPYLRRALALWQTLPDATFQVVNLYYLLEGAYAHAGLGEDVRRATQAFLTLTQETADPLLRMRAQEMLAVSAYRRGDFRASMRYSKAALEIIRAHGLSHYEPMSLNRLAVYCRCSLQFDEAIEAAQRALAIFRERDNHHGILDALNNLGYHYRLVGRYAEAEAVLTEGIARLERLSPPQLQVWLLYNMHELLLERGQPEAATDYLRQAQEVVDRLPIPYEISNVQLGWGRLKLEAGQARAAAQHFALALASALEASRPHCVPRRRSYLALAHLEQGDLPQAVRLSTQALAELAALTGGDDVQRIYLHHARIMQAAGKEDEARIALDKAYASLQAQKETLPDPRWQRDFLENVPIHVEIVNAHRAVQTGRPVKRITTHLPRAGAPQRGPLRPQHLVPVIWTVEAPEDRAFADKQARRRHRLKRLLGEAREQGAAPTVDDLAAALGASQRTIKYDLSLLRQSGHHVITRGARLSS